MGTERFVCWCFGIDGSVIDSICEDFDVDLLDEDVRRATLSGCRHRWGIGQELLTIIFEKIIRMYPELDEDKFDYDFSSPSYPDFYYKSERFGTKSALDKIAGREAA